MEPTWQEIGNDVWAYGDWLLVNMADYWPRERGAKNKERWRAFYKGKSATNVVTIIDTLESKKDLIEELVEHDLRLDALDILDKMAEARQDS